MLLFLELTQLLLQDLPLLPEGRLHSLPVQVQQALLEVGDQVGLKTTNT